MEYIDIDFEKSIKSLNPVTWIYNDDEKKVRQIGYIAEDVYDVDSLKYIVVLDEEDKPLGLRYDLLGLYAIEVLKSTLEKIDNLEKEIKQLKNNI
jgi:hypothetical protein